MIKIKIVCVGKIKEKYFRDAVDEYKKRLSRFAEVTEREVKEENISSGGDAETEKIVSLEGSNIEKELIGYVICLAIEGKKLSSEKLADKITSLKDAGEGEICFVIGGSYGISDKVKKQADELISFSDMTFPHTLVRVMLFEQIYRAFMISSGGKYHK